VSIENRVQAGIVRADHTAAVLLLGIVAVLEEDIADIVDHSTRLHFL